MLIKLSAQILLFLLTVHQVAGGSMESISPRDLQIWDCNTEPMPSLFASAESQFDRYAACLAATEGLRKMRDKKLNNNRSLFRDKDEASEEQRRTAAEYVLNSSKVIESLGMTVPQFNELGRKVGNNADLKEKVLEQAYLYRMASTLDMDRIPLVDDPASEKMLKATRGKRMKMFCESMQEIEQLRADHMKKLQRSLHVRQLPEGVNLSDPNVMPFLSPKVRAVVEAFPLQAEQIIKKHGLNSDEFNEMLNRAKGNMLFRYRVDKAMKEVGSDRV